ncbi:nucleotidyltransferase family protein [Cyanobium gracile]|uniref:Nucleotidyltransferase domain-containing protein n=1 Tax=Cyanobium gracile UHCC 0281 TaxID=3110309 RepID=A0ABU5SUC5_9CYAN|nr:nucleotidyltransferase domain-containing protein [Cyanobium gracile]MEA5442134.1 nucleotidyltransferase domain-containing protein [Cyanobium gracile UHCC 0281]
MAPESLALIAAHGGQDLRVFGSVIHGAAGLQSDVVDLLVDFPSSPSFEQYVDLKLALEDLLSARVDLATRRGLRPEPRQRIEQEAIPLA